MKPGPHIDDQRRAEEISRARRRTAVLFGDTLRRARRERGISQFDLALEAELDRSYVSLMERGIRQPSLHTLLTLARVLERPVMELITPVERALGR